MVQNLLSKPRRPVIEEARNLPTEAWHNSPEGKNRAPQCSPEKVWLYYHPCPINNSLASLGLPAGFHSPGPSATGPLVCGTWTTKVPKIVAHVWPLFWDNVHCFGYFGGPGTPLVLLLGQRSSRFGFRAVPGNPQFGRAVLALMLALTGEVMLFLQFVI